MVTWITDEIITLTDLYIKSTPKKERIDKGQFITPLEIANVMSDMFTIKKKSISVLDPGAGSGVLTASLIRKIVADGYVEKIKVDLYENDSLIFALLKKNTEKIKEICQIKNIELIYNIIEKNFIIENERIWMTEKYSGMYDYVICNPPYMKLKKDSNETRTMKNIVYGQPNLYYLFMAMAIKQLHQGAQAVFIVPRSFFNGSYFGKFREWLLMNSAIERIHHFESRERVFDGEILQETVVLKIVKSDIDQINITTSYDSNDMKSAKSTVVSKDTVVSKRYNTIRLPLNNKDTWTISVMDSFENTFSDLEIRFSTGPIVDFRNKDIISKEKTDKSVPLIWSCNFSRHEIEWPSKSTKFHQYIEVNDRVLPRLLPKTDYFLVKRFTTKEARHPLKTNLFLSENIADEWIGIENHINYLKATDTINRDILCGIAVLLNTHLYNDYFRIINGTTQINVSDLNSLPCPGLAALQKIGEKYLAIFSDDGDFREITVLDLLGIKMFQADNGK